MTHQVIIILAVVACCIATALLVRAAQRDLILLAMFNIAIISANFGLIWYNLEKLSK